MKKLLLLFLFLCSLEVAQAQLWGTERNVY